MSSNSYTVAARRAALNAQRAAEKVSTAATPVLAASAAEAAQVHANKAHDAAGDAGTPAAHLWAIAAQAYANAALLALATAAFDRCEQGSREGLTVALNHARQSRSTIQRDRKFAPSAALLAILDAADAALLAALA